MANLEKYILDTADFADSQGYIEGDGFLTGTMNRLYSKNPTIIALKKIIKLTFPLFFNFANDQSL